MFAYYKQQPCVCGLFLSKRILFSAVSETISGMWTISEHVEIFLSKRILFSAVSETISVYVDYF